MANQDKDPVTVSGTSNEAAEKATGQPWSVWMALLDEAGGREMNHKQLVDYLSRNHRISGWWVQQIAVTYENSRGLRQKHEMPDGYQISRSRTLAAPAEAIFNAWLDESIRDRWLPEASFTIRKATPHKSVRLAWGDGSAVEARLTGKEPDKTSLTVQHSKLADAGTAEQMKAYWAAALERLAEVLS